ncbi:MAG: TonB-dependent receptor plug domain-containing protein, partial [Desulfobacterales bacterium]|nr:TonB-dependent receptor plug domain-containing protein [Desulfobacterales bacterium]
MSLIKTIGTIFFLLLFLLIEQSFLFAEDNTNHDFENVNKLFQVSLEDLMNIEVVSATRVKQNITEAPSIMTVITAQQIRERGYQSIAEAVRTVPGFSLWVDNFMSSISVRGSNSIQGWNQNLKIMIDGQPVSYRPANWTPIDESLIPIRCVKKIEVIKGPASAMYGANAYLGAINIISFDGNEFDSLEVTGIGGSLDTYGGSFVVGKKIDEIDFMTAFSAQRSNRSGLSYPDPVPKDYTNIKSENDISEPKSFYGKISYKGLTMS